MLSALFGKGRAHRRALELFPRLTEYLAAEVGPSKDGVLVAEGREPKQKVNWEVLAQEKLKNLKEYLQDLAAEDLVVWDGDSMRFVDPKVQEYMEAQAAKLGERARQTQERYRHCVGENLDEVYDAIVTERVATNWASLSVNFAPAAKPVQVWNFKEASLKICQMHGQYYTGYVRFVDPGRQVVPEDCSLLNQVSIHGDQLKGLGFPGITFVEPASVENQWQSTYGFDTAHAGDVRMIVKENELLLDNQIAKSMGRELGPLECLEELRDIMESDGGRFMGMHFRSPSLESLEKETIQLAEQLIKIRELMPLYRKDQEAAEVEFGLWQKERSFPKHVRNEPNHDPDLDDGYCML